MNVFSRIALHSFCMLSLVACGTTQQRVVPVSTSTSAAADSLLRVAAGKHITIFSARASYTRSATGLVVSVGGRSVLFEGSAVVELISAASGKAARIVEALPVTCASCADGNGGWSGQNPNSVQSVQVSSTTLDVTFTASGNGDTVTITANGQSFNDYTGYSSGMLIGISYDASVFGGSIPPHGQVTVTSGGVTVGTGSW